MNSKNGIILIFLLHISFSMIGMEHAIALDQKKFNENKNRLLIALEEVNKDHGSKRVGIETVDKREILLETFLKSWLKRATKPPFENTFDSFQMYLLRADINIDWMARWYNEYNQNPDNPRIIAISVFVELIKKRVEKNLVQKEPGHTEFIVKGERSLS